jgi:hypothetical protein
MSSPAPFGNWNGHGHGVAVQTPPPSSVGNECSEDGITVKPMRRTYTLYSTQTWTKS